MSDSKKEVAPLHYVEDDIKDYLDNLRESGVTNMFGASVYLEEDFGYSKNDAKACLSYWMKTF